MCHYTHVAIMESWVIGCLKTIVFISEALPQGKHFSWVGNSNNGLYCNISQPKCLILYFLKFSNNLCHRKVTSRHYLQVFIKRIHRNMKIH